MDFLAHLDMTTMKIFFSSKEEFAEKKSYFAKFSFNIKQMFFKSNSKKTINELNELFEGKLKSNEFKEEHLEESLPDEYDTDMITLYEKCLSGATKENDDPKKRIKNVSNAMWKVIYLMIMSGMFDTEIETDIILDKVPLDVKHSSKCKEEDVILIKQRILLLAKVFASKYKTYRAEILKFQENDQFIIKNIKSFLRLRFETFKRMVQKYSPDILCLQEDDYDYYFDNDQWFQENYGFVRCKKDPSRR